MCVAMLACRSLRETGSEAAASNFERFLDTYDPRQPAPAGLSTAAEDTANAVGLNSCPFPCS